MKKASAQQKKSTRVSPVFDNRTFLTIIAGAAVVIFGTVYFSNYTIQPSYVAGAQQQIPANMHRTVYPLERVVTISEYMYAPQTISTKVGGTVIWTNRDRVNHTITADNGSFETGQIAPGETKRITFTKAGTYTYHCADHPTMTGTVIVQ